MRAVSRGPVAGVIVHARIPVAAATSSSLPPGRLRARFRLHSGSATPPHYPVAFTTGLNAPYPIGQFDRPPDHARARRRDSRDGVFGAATARSAP